MDVLTDNFDQFRAGFLGTVELTVASGSLALILGTLLAACRVSPVPVLRIFGAVVVNLVRNTPLVLLFFLVVFGFPKLGVNLPYLAFAVGVLGCYTGAFVCEAIRSGINTVAIGQAEAARSLGLTFSQTLGLVVLPQAFRAVIPPLGSILSAMTRNTAIAGGFNVFQLLSVSNYAIEAGQDVIVVFFWIALAYLLITLSIAAVFTVLERRMAVSR